MGKTKGPYNPELLELHEPTIAQGVPTKNKRWNRFSPMNPSQNEGKLGYFKLNISTACPPRTAVSVNTRMGFDGFVSLQPIQFAFDERCDGSNYVGSHEITFRLFRQGVCWRLNADKLT